MKLQIKLIKIFVFIIALTMIALSAFCLYALHITRNTKLDESKLKSYHNTITYLDCEGQQIKTASSRQEPVKLDHLPLHVKQSFVAIEDKRFFSHRGIDIIRIFGAIKNNLLAGGFKEGASTISQQLIKNTHLSGEKTINRKLKEFKLTMELEKKYSKDQILEKYLNAIYFGENSYGIESAAYNYFGKKACELSLSETATLAGLIKAPSKYSPFKNLEKSKERRDNVLKQMYNQKFISKQQMNSASAEQLNLYYNKKEDTSIGYLTEVRHQVEDILEKTHYSLNDDLIIHTNLNTTISNILHEEANRYKGNINHCALVVDNKSHGIISFSSDCSTTRRNPASTVKPWLIYAPTIYERDLTIASIILDEKTDFNGYTPTAPNDKYYGYVTLHEALSKSLNVPAVKLADFLGMEKLKNYAKKMNVPLEGGLGVALGGIERGMTLKEIADCYSVFSNGGDFYCNSYVKKITTKTGKIIYKSSQEGIRVFDEETAYIINETLHQSTINGTAKKLNECNLQLCCKTGTNGTRDGNIDAYCISYSPQYTICIWLGNADGSKIDNKYSGGTYPTIISCEIWQKLKLDSDKFFDKPKNICSVQLDKEQLDNAYKIKSGKDGPIFNFIAGTEPKETKDKNIKNIRHSVSGNLLSLSFSLDGYDGVEIVYGYNSKTKRLSFKETSVTTNIKLKSGKTYTLSILPYCFIGDQKTYGKPIEIKKIKASNEKITPPINNWWSDD